VQTSRAYQEAKARRVARRKRVKNENGEDADVPLGANEEEEPVVEAKAQRVARRKKKTEEAYVQPTSCTNTVVGVDPGKLDLLYASSGEGKDEQFRYTQNQRRYETKAKKHRRVRRKKAMKVIDGKTVQEWETELSKFNRKTLDVGKFKEYLVKKNEVNSKLLPHYEELAYRKMKWGAKVNRRRSEDRMVNRFKAKFGCPEKVVLCWGDWSTRGHMRFHEPTPGIGLRNVFRRAGYEVLLVDEYRTSCCCYNCEGGTCEKFREVRNPRPWRRETRPKVLCHGLLRCKSCERLWNRDRNGSLNILRCAIAARRGETRPAYLTRGNNFSGARSVSTAQGEGLLSSEKTG
jgi:transposase